MFTEYLIQDGTIPPEYADYIKKTCECGWDIERTETLTYAWCANPACPYHEKYRTVDMMKYLGFTNVGPATAEKLLKTYGVKYHIDLIPHILPQRVSLYLWEVVLLIGVRGYNDKLQELVKGFKSMQEFLDCPSTPGVFKGKAAMLLRAESYFDIKEPLSTKVINVMITGSITGYKDREDFVRDINNQLGSYVQVRLVGKRISNVDCLITNNKDASSGKAQLARSNGIPILTPQEFLTYYKHVIINK